MLRLRAGTRTFDVAGVVLDKDGTLLDLHQAWGPRTVSWVELLASEVNGPPEMANAIFDVFGYDAKKKRALPDGPFISANELKLVTLAAGVLYQYGIPWIEAEEIAYDTIKRVYGAPLTPIDVLPLGDVAGTVRRLRRSGVAVAIATADSRATTEQSLQLLDIANDVNLVMCGDDALPQKPDAAVMAWIAGELNCHVNQLLMVGDTITDMLTGRNGGAAGTVAIVPGGASAPEGLRRHADAVLTSIAELSWT